MKKSVAPFTTPARGGSRQAFHDALVRLPHVAGAPVCIRFLPALHAHRGRLVSGRQIGAAVHAATFLRKREIILETELLDRPGELQRILAHEVFHFAWLRLGRSLRRSFEDLIRKELAVRARGELGWSAEWRKTALGKSDAANRTRRWREYLCESFCDTAAWLLCGARRHPETTLARSFRERRRAWFRRAGLLERLKI